MLIKVRHNPHSFIEWGLCLISVTKSLHGNVDYKHHSKRSYGGSERKLKKMIDEDPKIQDLLAKIKAKRDEQW